VQITGNVAASLRLGDGADGGGATVGTGDATPPAARLQRARIGLGNKNPQMVQMLEIIASTAKIR